MYKKYIKLKFDNCSREFIYIKNEGVNKSKKTISKVVNSVDFFIEILSINSTVAELMLIWYSKLWMLKDVTIIECYFWYY